MQNNSSFIVSGIIAFSLYLCLCFSVLFYIMSPEQNMINITPTSTSIELDMIVEKAERKWSKERLKKSLKKKRLLKNRLQLNK